MFKALLAASLAMLLCCAAAVLAGPVQPPSEGHPLRAAAPMTQMGEPSPLHVILPAPLDRSTPEPRLLDSDIVIGGFVAVPLSDTTYASALPVGEREDIALPDPSVQPATIPLPTPLYAALALLMLALFGRRAIARMC